jgi:hypothetical protein
LFDLESDFAVALVSAFAFAVPCAGATVLLAAAFVEASPVAEAIVAHPTLASVASAQMVSIFRGFKFPIPPPARIKGAP